MPRLTTEVSQSLMDEVAAHCRATGESVRHFVSQTLSEALGLEHATLFQISTTGALVQGVYGEAVTVGSLRQHGDFGLGTFEGLDGEMVVLDGQFYQAHEDSRISVPSDAAAVPFATLTWFRPEHRARLHGIESMPSLLTALDEQRRSDNLFFAVRLDGQFSEVHVRVACKSDPGVPLDEAVASQAEFHLSDVAGSMVGFWTPPYSKTISVAGWHLHFLSDDRERGGHVLGCSASLLDLAVHDLDDLHLAVPETQEFLHADLTSDPGAAIDRAEH